MTDAQRQILQHVDGGEWIDLSQQFSIAAIARAKVMGLIRQDREGPIIGAGFTITHRGRVALGAST